MVTAGRRKPGVLTGRLSRGAVLTLLALGSQLGCTREFYREWANQDASEAVFEKSRDPRWRLDAFSIEPPALSRFADPYDQDFPPAPPDDAATEALSPVPQWPDNRLIVPVEANGYLTMLERWKQEREEAVARLGPTINFPGAPRTKHSAGCARCSSIAVTDTVSVCSRSRLHRLRRLAAGPLPRQGPPDLAIRRHRKTLHRSPPAPTGPGASRNANSGCEFRDKRGRFDADSGSG